MTRITVLSKITLDVSSHRTITMTLLQKDNVYGYFITAEFCDGRSYQTRKFIGYPSLKRALAGGNYDFEIRRGQPMNLIHGWIQVEEIAHRHECE